MKVAVVGVGAVGGWLGARFAAAGHEVSLLARGETLAALQRDGLGFTEDGETRHHRLDASADPLSLGAQDLIIVAVKAPAMASAAPAVAAMLTSETLVVPAMNGVPWWFADGLGAASAPTRAVVDPDGGIGAGIPARQVIGCVVHASLSQVSPGHSRRHQGNGVILGEPRGGASARVEALRALFGAVGLETSASPSIRRDVWYKLWGNMTMNPVSAITGAMSDRILDDPDVRTLLAKVMIEAAEVGERIGCPIDEAVADRIEMTRRLGAFRTSMLQDVDAGRTIELDALVAAPRAIAAAVGVPTPNLDMLHGLVRLFAETRGLLP